MTNKDMNQSDKVYKIPFIESEYVRYKVEKRKNQILCALAATNILWLMLFVLAIVFLR